MPRPIRSRPTVTGLALALVAGLGLTACGSGSSSSSGEASSADADTKTTISILAPSYTDSSEADWKKIIAGYNAKYPNVTVKLQIEAWDGFTDKVQARIQSNDLPDILNDNNFAENASSKILYPIDEVTSAATRASIVPSLLANGKGQGGTQWAVPDIASARILEYNVDLFSQAGITAPPTTWAELETDAQKISALGNGVYGYGMPLGSEEAQVESTIWVWGGGGDWTDGDKITVNSSKNVAAFAAMKKFIDDGGTEPNPGATGRQAVSDLFNQGKIGMFSTQPGLVAETRAKFPGIKIGLAPLPSENGTTKVSLGVTDFIEAFDNHDAKRKAATKAFLDYFYSPTVYSDWSTATGLLPVTTKAIALQSAATPANKPFYDALPTVRYLPQGNPKWPTLQSALQANAGAITSKSAKATLDEIQAQVDAG